MINGEKLKFEENMKFGLAKADIGKNLGKYYRWIASWK
jgi:hypothetical protein